MNETNSNTNFRAANARLSAKSCRRDARRAKQRGDEKWAKIYRARAREYDAIAARLEAEVAK